MNRAELLMRRKQVVAFVKADPFELIVHRPQPAVKNPLTGGMIKSGDAELLPQEARIVQNVRRFTSGVEHAEAGDIPNSQYRLIATYATDLEPLDKFMWQGEWYKVMEHGIHRARVESVYAAIELLGPPNGS